MIRKAELYGIGFVLLFLVVWLAPTQFVVSFIIEPSDLEIELRYILTLANGFGFFAIAMGVTRQYSKWYKKKLGVVEKL